MKSLVKITKLIREYYFPVRGTTKVPILLIATLCVLATTHFAQSKVVDGRLVRSYPNYTNLTEAECNDEISKTKNINDCVAMKFRYLILENSQWTATVRRIEVFMDETAFTENHLSEMFDYLSNKNPRPKHLTIVVSTNWKQLPHPSECPTYIISDQPDRLEKFDYHFATFSRREHGEKTVKYFEYNPILGTSDLKTISMTSKK